MNDPNQNSGNMGANQQSYTENGALSHGPVRGQPMEQLSPMLLKAWNEDPRDTLKLIFQTRDCRGGKGEKQLFIMMCQWLATHSEENLVGNLLLVPEYGSWLDLVKIADATSTSKVESKIAENCWKILANQLYQDRTAMHEGKPCTLVAKWVPTEGSKWDKKTKGAHKVANLLEVSMKDLRREYLTPLRQYLNVVERMMCQRAWGDIEYSKVPGHAMNKLRKAFARHDPNRFQEWSEALGRGEVKVNAKTLHPHEIVTKYSRESSFDQVLESQWLVLQSELAKLGSLGKTLVLSDVSGSMSGLPMEVSVALGLMISSLSEAPFRDGIITFHTNPTFHMVQGKNLMERINNVRRMSWGGSTDFTKVFDLILGRARQAELASEAMPERLVVLSDMQFNQADSGLFQGTNYQSIVKKYENYGYKVPQIVFWNLRANTVDFPIPSAHMKNVCLLSGFSPMVLKALLNRPNISPYQIVRDTIDCPRYEKVRYF